MKIASISVTALAAALLTGPTHAGLPDKEDRRLRQRLARKLKKNGKDKGNDDKSEEKVGGTISIVEFCQSRIPSYYDSGEVSTASTVISHTSAPWIQLNLSGTVLASDAKLILIGGEDIEVEVLTANALEANRFSSVFGGSSVAIWLVSSSTQGEADPSRVVVSEVSVGICNDPDKDGDGVAESICGNDDDRIASTDVRAGRIGGCTGWLISENVFIQAGHCGTPNTGTRIHFTFGDGVAHSRNQYAVDVATYRGLDEGVGRDWGAGRLHANRSTGQFPGIAQQKKCLAAGGSDGCGWYTLGTVPSDTARNNIRITGYGTYDDNGLTTRRQRTHAGALASIEENHLRYVLDTTGGNSGSPVIHEETGHAIGVHTHGGCSTGGANSGTRIDREDFAAHVEWLLRSCTSDVECNDGNPDNGKCVRIMKKRIFFLSQYVY